VRQESKPWTRWWWLGSDVDKAGLTFNLESLARAGIGGVEITPIYGVQGRQDHYIDYLSPQWMEMLSVCTVGSTTFRHGGGHEQRYGMAFWRTGCEFGRCRYKSDFSTLHSSCRKKFRRADSGERQETTNFCLFGQADGLFR